MQNSNVEKASRMVNAMRGTIHRVFPLAAPIIEQQLKFVVRRPTGKKLGEDGFIAAVSSTGTLIFAYELVDNPEYWSGLVMHELLHLVLDSFKRREDRDPVLWNIAQDAIINAMVRDLGYKLPDGGVDLAYVRRLLDINISDEQLLGEYTDLMIYDHIAQNAIALPSPFDEIIIDGDGTSVEVSDLQKKLKDAIHQQMAIGRLPGSIERAFETLNKVHLPWHQILTRVVHSSAGKHAHTRFNKKYIGNEIYLEVRVPRDTHRVVVAVDTSGSITPEIIGTFNEIIRHMLSMGIEVDVIIFDAEVHSHTKRVRGIDAIKYEGGGGTSFIPPIEKVVDSYGQLREVTLVILTDGMGTFPSDVPKTLEVIWVIIPGGVNEVPFGRKIQVK